MVIRSALKGVDLLFKILPLPSDDDEQKEPPEGKPSQEEGKEQEDGSMEARDE